MLCEDKDREHAMLVEIGRQLVQLVGEVTLPWHGIQVAVQGVNDDQLAAILHAPTYAIRELPGRNLRRIDLLQGNQAFTHVPGKRQAELLGARERNPSGFIEAENIASLALGGHLGRVLQGKGRLTGAGLTLN